MDNLRWVLIGLGVLVVVGIYLFDRIRRRLRAREHEHEELDSADEALLEGLQVGRDDPAEGLEGALNDLEGIMGERLDSAPGLDDLAIRTTPREPEPDDLDDEHNRIRIREASSRVYSVEPAPATPPGEELIVVFSVMPGPGEAFDGGEVRAALEAVDMRPGEMQIYHHYGLGEARSERSVFSAASILEPGFLDPEALEGTTLPGLVLFMRLPGPQDPRVAFELLLNTGQRLAEYLGGELRDQTRSVISPQTVAHLRDRIADFGRRRLVAAG